MGFARSILFLTVLGLLWNLSARAEDEFPKNSPCNHLLMKASGATLTAAQRKTFDALVERGFQPAIAEKMTLKVPRLSQTLLKNKKSKPITVFRSMTITPEEFDPAYDDHHERAKSNEINTCTSLDRSLQFAFEKNPVGTLIKMQIVPEIVTYKRVHGEPLNYTDFVLDNTRFKKDLSPFIEQMWAVSKTKQPGFKAFETPYEDREGNPIYYWIREVPAP